MVGASFEDAYGPSGHGPPSFGAAGSQFSPQVETIHHDFSKLDIDNRKEKNGGLQIPKSARRVSFSTSKGAQYHYEYYSFTKRNDWQVADRIKLNAPQQELERTVSKYKKNSSVRHDLKKMSPERRAQIDRLLDQKNLGESSKDPQWECVFIDSLGFNDREIGGKWIREHKKMDVIVAKQNLPGSAMSKSPERKSSFVGEKSDINEPLKSKDKSKNKDKSSKDGKGDHNGRDDPFSKQGLFTRDGIPLDERGPIAQHQAPHQPSGHNIPPGIELLDDGHGANDPIVVGDHLPPATGARSFHVQHPNFRQPTIHDFNNSTAPFRKPTNSPHIIQNPPQAQRHYVRRWPGDDSSFGSEDEHALFDDDERSSHTSYDDHYPHHIKYETPSRRDSLRPHRRSSMKRPQPVYREHHRGSSYPIERPSNFESRRRESRYHGERGEMIVERRPRRHSSRERREAIRYAPPRRLEYQAWSPPLTPVSGSSYSPSRRHSDLLYPDEVGRDREHERRTEDYILEKKYREREEAFHRKDLDIDRDYLDRLGRRTSGQDRYRFGR